jgi:glycerol kinase
MLDDLASHVPDASGVRMLPALAGLGAPWWDADARVTISGLSGATRRPHLARAALDAIAQRTVDIVEAMAPALPSSTVPLRVDGGLTGSDLLVERLADLVGRPVDVATDPESTALGTALLAAIGGGQVEGDAVAAVAGTKRRVQPRLDEVARRAERSAWIEFVQAARALAPERLTRST